MANSGNFLDRAVDKMNGYDFVAIARKFLLVPVCIAAAALLVLIIFGAEVAIEFRGGTLITYSYTGEIDADAVGQIVGDADYGSVEVTKGSAFGSDLETITVAFVSHEGLTADVQSALTDTLRAAFPDNDLTVENSQDVNPSSGQTFFLKCLVAVIFSFILLVVYIAFRFKKIGGWSAGAFALVALLIDVAMVIATFIFFRLAIDANFIAVALTILGYSINNTIVIYDRIRENRTLLGTKITHRDLVNRSVVQSFTRTLNTTLATCLAIIVIVIVALATGVSSIISFAVPILVGMVSGFFTSLMLSGPLWVLWQEHKIKTKATKPQSKHA